MQGQEEGCLLRDCPQDFLGSYQTINLHDMQGPITPCEAADGNNNDNRRLAFFQLRRKCSEAALLDNNLCTPMH